jgi:hypothetical protein
VREGSLTRNSKRIYKQSPVELSLNDPIKPLRLTGYAVFDRGD